MTIFEGFAAVPNWLIRDSSASIHAIAVYAALASHSGPGGIYPSQDTLARESRCSESSVRRALVELELLGVVQRVRRKSAKGRASNGYVLTPNGPLRTDERQEVPVTLTGTAVEVPVTLTGGSGQGAQIVPYTEEEPRKKNPSKGVAVDQSSTFETLWRSWPSSRRGAKQPGVVGLAKAVRESGSIDIVKAAVARDVAVWSSWPQADLRFVPHFSTWMNQKRWEPESAAQPRMGDHLRAAPVERAQNVLELGRELQAVADGRAS